MPAVELGESRLKGLAAFHHLNPVGFTPVGQMRDHRGGGDLRGAGGADLNIIHHLGHFSDGGPARNGRPQPMPGNGIGLGKTVQQDQSVLPPVPVEEVMRRFIRWHAIAVGFIKDEPDIPLNADIHDRLHHIIRIDRPGGVVGADQRDGPCPRRDGGADNLRIRHKAVFGEGIGPGHIDPGHAERGGMVEIAGPQHQHVITRASHGQRSKDKGLIAARRDHDFPWVNRRGVEVAAMAGIGLSQRILPLNRAIG